MGRERTRASRQVAPGVFAVVGSLGGCVVASLYVTCLIAGTPVNG